MVNAVIYARFSSHSQNEQSIEGQLQACYEFASRNGYTIIHEYIDRALSGTTDKRPEFQKMIDDSSRKQFEFIIVYQLDRFARNRYDSATNKARLKKHGIRVLSARENITDDASGILIEGVLESMAEYYSAELSQKINRGMDLNASKCLSNGGAIPLGFCVDKEKKYQIDKKGAQTVQTIFNMYADGATMKEIIDHLNRLKIKTVRGGNFNKNSLQKILTNKRYIGHYIYKDVDIENGVPRIISDELFERVQSTIEKNRKAPARAKAKEEYLLTTKLVCGLCESPMVGVSAVGRSKTYYYYTCNHSNDANCEKKRISKEILEDLVVTETKKLLTPKTINQIAKKIVDICNSESNTQIIKRLQKLIKDNKKETENLMIALEKGEIVDLITQRIRRKQLERQELEKQLAKETMKHPILTVDEVKFFLNKFKAGDEKSIKYRKSLIDTFVRGIYLQEDKMTILYNVQDGQTFVPFEPKWFL